MEEYFRKIGLIKSILKEINHSSYHIRRLKHEMEQSSSASKEKKISENLQYCLESTYILVMKTQNALNLLNKENSTIYANHARLVAAPETAESSLLRRIHRWLNSDQSKSDGCEEAARETTHLLTSEAGEGHVSATDWKRNLGEHVYGSFVQQPYVQKGRICEASVHHPKAPEDFDPSLVNQFAEGCLDLEGGPVEHINRDNTTPILVSDALSKKWLSECNNAYNACQNDTPVNLSDIKDMWGIDDEGLCTDTNTDTTTAESPDQLDSSKSSAEKIYSDILDINVFSDHEDLPRVCSSLNQPSNAEHINESSLTCTDRSEAHFAISGCFTSPLSAKTLPDARTTPAEYRIRINVYSSTVVSFRDSVKEFQQVQNEYKDAAEWKCLTQIRSVYPEARLSDIAEILQGGTTSLDVQNALRCSLNQDYDEFAASWKKVQSTYHDVKRLENCVIHIHKMFIELNALLDDRQFHVVELEKAVSDVRNETSQAKDNLALAYKYQLASRKIGCWLAVVVIVVSSGLFSRALPFSISS